MAPFTLAPWKFHRTLLTLAPHATLSLPRDPSFLEAARRLGCDPKRCIVFEDSPLGIAGAHAAGCLAVGLPDARMPSNGARFVELSPRWLLRDGIGSFDPSALLRAPPSRRHHGRPSLDVRATMTAAAVVLAAAGLFAAHASAKLR